MASDARPSSKQRSDVPPPIRKPRGTLGGRIISAPVSDYCMICGDRACSHHYYGVAACHGCKCFFWRSVKQQAHYECRFTNNCEITVNGRNSCRACRFNRCLKAGMQPEAVRMNKPENTGICVQKRSAPSSVDELRHSEDEVFHVPEKAPKMDFALVSSLLEVDEKIYELADFSENEKPVRLGSVYDVFMYPECLDCYRTRVSYCVRLRRATEEELNFCKRRMLTIACDYIRHLEVLQMIPEADKVALLRNSYGPLTIFEVTVGTVKATNDSSLLCLPTGITVSKNEELVSNSFMSQKLVMNILDTLRKMLVELHLSQEEEVMLKAIIVLNSEISELSTEAKRVIGEFRDRVHNCLYQCCAEADSAHAAMRFAKLLHVIPKITLLARDLVEHIKVVHTFDNESNCVDPLFFELFGDIFQEERESFSAQTNAPFKWNIASPDQSDQSVS
jgi:hypothetical protein